jgi:hypothetical protein
MQNEENPFAAPQVTNPLAQPAAAAIYHRGVFRQGDLLVMHKRARLPNRCVKTNEPTVGRLSRNLSWHHPLIYLSVFAGLLVYVVLAIVLRKQASIEIGLGEQGFRRRRSAILIGWTSFLGGIGIAIGSPILADQIPAAIYAWPIGLFLAIGGGIYGLLVAQVVAPKRITDDYVWLKGVHPDYLAELPAWPYTS